MRANKGLSINGIKYKRLLCTVGGVKMSTVVYVSERVYETLKKRLANNHDCTVPLVPAKYSAYEALSASGSNVVSWPASGDSKIPGGTIVVRDVITRFLADFIDVDDSNYPCEPIVELKKDQEFENNANDGCGIMTVELAKRCENAGASMLTDDFQEALDTAVQFVYKCMEATLPIMDEHYYGAAFELCLGELNSAAKKLQV